MAPTTEFRWIKLAEARALGLDDLVALHWEEIESHKDASPLDVDWAAYRDLERTGRLKIAALLLDGRMIGYSSFFLHAPMHSRSTTWAISDAVYLDPDHRRGWAGVKMIKQAERDLKAMGARVILYGVKTDRNLSSKRQHDSLGLLLAKLGYSTFDQSWSKAL